MLDGFAGFLGETAAFEADLVHRAGGAGVAVHDHVGRNVLHDLGATAHHGVHADAAELVHGHVAAQDGVIFHHDVPGEAGETGHDDVVAEKAVVRDVGVGEKQIVVADDGGGLGSGGAVDGHAFAENIVIADFEAGDAAFPFQVLGLEPEGDEGKNFIAGAEAGVAIDDGVRMQAAAVAKGDVLADDAVRADMAIGADLRAGMDDGGGVDHGVPRSRIMKVTSASLTTSSPTLQTPLARPILPRTLVSSTSMMRVSPGPTGLRHLTSSADMK